MMEYLSWLGTLRVSSVALFCITLITSAILWVWQKDKTPFNLKDLVTDTKTQRISPEKFVFIGSWTVSTWVLIAQTVEKDLTEWFYCAYIAAFVAARGVSQYLSTKKDISSANSPTP